MSQRLTNEEANAKVCLAGVRCAHVLCDAIRRLKDADIPASLVLLTAITLLEEISKGVLQTEDVATSSLARCHARLQEARMAISSHVDEKIELTVAEINDEA